MALLYIDDKESFEEILNDRELNAFFTSFTQHYNRICKEKREIKNKKIEELRPSLDELNLIIDNIKKSGIQIDGLEKLISYIQESSPFHHFPLRSPADLLFNGVRLDTDDFIYMAEGDEYLEKICYYLENKYKTWKKENKTVEKDLAKLEKKNINQNRDIFDQVKLDRDINSLEVKLNQGKHLNDKLTFITQLTIKQRKLLVSLYNTFNNLNKAYKQFNLIKMEIRNRANKDSKNNTKEAYEEMINNSLIMPDNDELIRKMFKILLKSELRELKYEYLTRDEEEEEMLPENINKDVVLYFINLNKEKILEMFETVFDDVELITETLGGKVLKKEK